MNKYSPKTIESISNSNKRNPYTLVYRPSSLDIYSMLPPSLHHRMDDALYLISILIYKASHGMVNSDGYTNLNFDILAQVMDCRTLRKIKQSLIDSDVIQCDGIAIPGAKSLGYRLHPRFRNDSAIPSIIKNRRIVRQLDKYFERKLTESKKIWLPHHHELNEQQHHIEIDLEQSSELIKKLEPHAKKRKSKAGNGLEIITRRTKLAQSSLCQSIQNKSNVLKVGTTGRVYNCVTSLSRELRPALRYKGNQLESVDIRNSQPALLSKLVEDNLKNGNVEPRKREARMRGNASHIGTGRSACCCVPDRLPADSRALGDMVQEHDILEEQSRQEDLYGLHFPNDVVHYFGLTSNGSFYNFIWERVQLAGYQLHIDSIKSKFLTDIFAKKKWVRTRSGFIVECDYDSVVEEVFRDHFPTVYRFICETNKTDAANGITFLNKHAVLIRMLQQTEAKLVIEGAAPIALAHASRPLVLTCHDAFFCGTGEAALLEECLMEVAAAQGHRISTKTECFR